MHTQLTLYSHADEHKSHRVRLALAIKNIACQHTVLGDLDERPEYLANHNPYNTLPILVDRDITLYHAMVILEYLDERYKQYPLFADTPTERARQRQLIWRLENDWIKPAEILLTHLDTFDETQAQQAKKQCRDLLITLTPVFKNKPYFMSDTFSILDCVLVPILWRLPQLSLGLPAQTAQALSQYMRPITQLPAFKTALSADELLIS